MPRTGRPPKPTEQKRKIGNPGKRGLPAPSKLAAVPQVVPEPVELPPHETLDLIFEHGKAWLAASDTTSLALLRESFEERVKLRDAVMEFGSLDLRRALRDLDRQIIGQLSLLGFDPVGRSRLGVAELRAASVLENLKAGQTKPTPARRTRRRGE